MKLFGKAYHTHSDEELMEKLASGDQHAFTAIYERYATPLLNYFYRFLWKDREKAEDFVHDLFAKIIQKPEYFDTTRSFKTWVYSVANNMCKNEYKRESVRSGTKNGLEDYGAIADDSLNAFSLTHYSFFTEEFHSALSQLDEKHREVFRLRHFDGLSIKEIAQTLHINEGTIKSRIFYATKQLSETLMHYQPEKTRHHG